MKTHHEIYQAIWKSLAPTFDNPGMRINNELFLAYLNYTSETGEDVSYEEFLGNTSINKKEWAKLIREALPVVANLAGEAMLIQQTIKKVIGRK